MRGRFTKQQLYELRNRIPIRELIERELSIPNRISGNVFRFECPLCGGYHTGIKTDKNLARCFDCNENFNTIDLVLKVRKGEFYENASFLWDLYQSMKQRTSVAPVLYRPEPERKIWPVHFDASDEGDCGELFSVGYLMESFGLTGGNQQNTERFRKLDFKMETLEQQVVRLAHQLNKLEKFVATTSRIKAVRDTGKIR